MRDHVEHAGSMLVNSGDGRYQRYFAQLSRALSLLGSWSERWSSGAVCAARHTDYLRGLGACFSMLQSRYLFETGDAPMIDLDQSGFPHSFMLARMAIDRAEALSQHRKNDSLSALQLKHIFLDELFATGAVNTALLNRIACARYAEVVAAMDRSFDPRFTCGEPEPEEAPTRRYRLEWSTFDPLEHRPVLCGMLFEYSGNDLTRSMHGLRLVLRHETRSSVSIAALARYIDSGASDIHPLALSRVIVGPLLLPGSTGAEPLQGLATLSDTLVERIGERIAIGFIADHTYAVSVRRPSALAVRFGVNPAESRVYAIRVDDPLCYERGADRVERMVILPHRALQGLSAAEHADARGPVTFIPYLKDGEFL